MFKVIPKSMLHKLIWHIYFGIKFSFQRRILVGLLARLETVQVDSIA